MGKLLYIVSTGHSGSTLLDLICGTIPGVFSMGEVQYLTWQLIQGNNSTEPQSYCSCGKKFDKCEFYSEVFKNINNINIYKNPDKFTFSLNKSIIRGKKSAKLNIINKSINIYFRFSFFKPLADLIYLYFLPGVKRNWQLFDTVSDKAKSKFIVDSSKDPIRFWLLWKYRKKDTKLIILKREPKGVVSSSHYGLNFQMIKNRLNVWLKFYCKIIPGLVKQLPENDILFLNYEDICKNPTFTRKEIATFLQLIPPNENMDSLSPYKYHTVQGNPMRLKKEDIRINYDERWMERLSEDEILFINNKIKTKC